MLLRCAVAMAIPLSSAWAGPIRFSHNRIETSMQYGTVAGIMPMRPLTTRDNTWWRTFRPTDFGVDEAVVITSVRIGVEQAHTDEGEQAVLLSLFEAATDHIASASEDPALPDITLIGQTTRIIPDMEMQLVTFPVEAHLRADRDLVVAITPPDHGAGGDGGGVFFIGTNRYGQSAPSLITCPSAGDERPRPYHTFDEGGADLAIVMTVFGHTICTGDCDGTGEADFFDFLCFLTAFSSQDPEADCDDNGALDIFDLICFQNAIGAGCD